MARELSFKADPDRDELIKFLRPMKHGETISYETMSAKIGRDVRGAARHVLSGALRWLEKHERIVFGVISKSGIKRLTDSEVVDYGGHFLEKSRRAAKRSVSKYSAVSDFASLPPEQRTKHQLGMSIAALVQATISVKSKKEIENCIVGGTQPTAALLEGLKK